MTDPANTPAVSRDAQAMMRFEASKKSAIIAYFLWIALGMIGGHRFYFGGRRLHFRKLWVTIIYIFLIVFGILTVIIQLPFRNSPVSLVGFLPIAIWMIVDAFLIPGWTAKHNLALVNSLTGEG